MHCMSGGAAFAECGKIGLIKRLAEPVQRRLALAVQRVAKREALRAPARCEYGQHGRKPREQGCARSYTQLL